MQSRVDEKVLLNSLLKSYPEFSRFYEEERKEKIGYIDWVRDDDIPDGIEAIADLSESSIHYRNYPESITDAYTMAHEIMHLVRYKENELISIGYSVDLFGDLTVCLKSMLEDPIVDSFLQKNYKFDLLPYYRYVIDYGKKNVTSEPLEILGRLLDGFNLANYMFRWDFIKDQRSHDDWCKYLDWYKTQYPNCYTIALDAANSMRTIGLDTIKKQQKIVIRLIDKYNLNGIIKIL